MRALVLAAFAAFAFMAAPASAQTRPQTISGVWLGQYSYPPEAGRAPVKFQARFASAANGRVTGSMIEPNTFGDQTAYFLTSNIAGSIGPNGAVLLDKTYDGTGGQTHTVHYEGAFSVGCVAGQWAIGGSGGPFHMCPAGAPRRP